MENTEAVANAHIFHSASNNIKPFSSILQLSQNFGEVFQQLLPNDMDPRDIAAIFSREESGRFPFLFSSNSFYPESNNNTTFPTANKKKELSFADLKGLFSVVMHQTAMKDVKKWTDALLALKKEDFEGHNIDKKRQESEKSDEIEDEESKNRRAAMFIERKESRIGDDIVRMRVFILSLTLIILANSR